MQRLLGPRTIVEAVFLVAVPVVAVVSGAGTWTIVGASAAAYLLVLVVETMLWRETGAAAASGGADVPVMPVVAPPLVPPVPAPVVETAGPADPVEPAPDEEPPHEDEPEPEPAPPPVAERPALTALPTLPPPPQPAPPQVPEPPSTNVVPLGIGSAPREWSLWELERLVREHSGDPVRGEERRFLLMYLRDFAGADGQLPVEFDVLVRESFGDLLAL